MHLTTMNDKQTVLQSAATLRDISSNPEFQLAFVEAGGLEAAIDLASSDADVDLNTVALGIVRHLSVPMPLKTKILQSGVVNVVSRCIENGVENNDLLYQCASSLANIAEHAQNKAEETTQSILESQQEIMRHTAEAMTGTMKMMSEAMQDMARTSQEAAEATGEAAADVAETAADEVTDEVEETTQKAKAKAKKATKTEDA